MPSQQLRSSSDGAHTRTTQDFIWAGSVLSPSSEFVLRDWGSGEALPVRYWGLKRGAWTMKGRGQIDGPSFGPEAVKAIGEAFDQAWAEIAGNFGNIPAEIEGARLRLE